MIQHHRANVIVKQIRANGYADLVLNGQVIRTGFQGSGHAELVMVGGGYYSVRTLDGHRIEIGKGELIAVQHAE
jgi:hypothetical protein